MCTYKSEAISATNCGMHANAPPPVRPEKNRDQQRSHEVVPNIINSQEIVIGMLHNKIVFL